MVKKESDGCAARGSVWILFIMVTMQELRKSFNLSEPLGNEPSLCSKPNLN